MHLVIQVVLTSLGNLIQDVGSMMPELYRWTVLEDCRFDLSQTKGTNTNIGALIIRIGFWGPQTPRIRNPRLPFCNPMKRYEKLDYSVITSAKTL